MLRSDHLVKNKSLRSENTALLIAAIDIVVDANFKKQLSFPYKLLMKPSRKFNTKTNGIFVKFHDDKFCLQDDMERKVKGNKFCCNLLSTIAKICSD